MLLNMNTNALNRTKLLRVGPVRPGSVFDLSFRWRLPRRHKPNFKTKTVAEIEIEIEKGQQHLAGESLSFEPVAEHLWCVRVTLTRALVGPCV